MIDKEVCDFVMEKLDNLVHYLAGRYNSVYQVLMEEDEIVGELYYELVKGMDHYSHLNKEKLLIVLKTMLNNRIGELKYKYFVTHRKAGAYAISIDVLIERVDGDRSIDVDRELPLDIAATACEDPEQDVENLLISKEVVEGVKRQLTPEAQYVFDAIIYGHERLSWMVWFSAVRAAFVYKTGGTAKMQPWHIADALCVPVDQVKSSMAEIKKVVEEVYNGR